MVFLFTTGRTVFNSSNESHSMFTKCRSTVQTGSALVGELVTNAELGQGRLMSVIRFITRYQDLLLPDNDQFPMQLELVECMVF